ncbi:hypothetical protein E9529_04545 [Blastococcus sp. KM273128]|uniref:hypothetical protein n=1 Tax=Blastococcus sp. KM273128 TaxID=2570314 RepID=UPI001F3909BA|nr:hypothetical protein [Blastococcus sp. KM273128]MCF6743552.1 hypothetical protein [Blastococcus sp. KM273128]
MARAKRTAEQRSAAAIAEDLGQAREAGGLHRADESELAATLDLIEVAGGAAGDPLTRARDLLLHHVRRGCELHKTRVTGDSTGQAAADSLATLLSRLPTDNRLTKVIRQAAAGTIGHHISADAVRKREDRIIGEIAVAVFADFQARLNNEPPTIEAAIHHLMPRLSDLRQDLHDLLLMVYDAGPPADPQERWVITEHYRRTALEAGKVVVACEQLFQAGLRLGPKSADEYWFMHRADRLRSSLFRQRGDRAFMLDFSRSDRCHIHRGCDHLQSTAEGVEVYGRWREWTHSCYPTCEFERSLRLTKMCSPHAFLAEAYETELRYLDTGLSQVAVGNDPIVMHHGLLRDGGDPQQDSGH